MILDDVVMKSMIYLSPRREREGLGIVLSQMVDQDPVQDGSSLLPYSAVKWKLIDAPLAPWWRGIFT